MPTITELRPIADVLGIGHTSKSKKDDLVSAVEEAIGILEDRADAMGTDLTAGLELSAVEALVAGVRAAEDQPAAPLAEFDHEFDDDLDDDAGAGPSEVGDHVDEVDPRDPANQTAAPLPPRPRYVRDTSTPQRIVGGPATVYELAAWFVIVSLGSAPDYAGETVTRDIVARANADGYQTIGDPTLEVLRKDGDRIRLRALVEVAQ